MRTTKIITGIVVAVLVLFIDAQAQPAFLTNGLMAYYPFNGNANDASGNGRNLIPTNNPPYISGIKGQGITLGKTNYYCRFTAPLITNVPYSFSCWFSVPTNNNVGTNTLVAYADGVGVTILEQGNTTQLSPENIYCTINTNLPQNNSIVSFNGNAFSSRFGHLDSPTFTIVPDKWVHIIVACDSNTNGTIFINGILAATTTNLPFKGSANFAVGTYGGYGQKATYAVDEVRVYKRALNSNEVLQLFGYDSQYPIITQDLTNSVAIYGQSATLGVTVRGFEPLGYQWYLQGSGTNASASALTIANFVYGAIVTNGGSGYGAAPSVSFVGGGGSGAAGYATVSNGVVSTITVTNAGYGYTNPPTVVIGAPNGFLAGQTNNSYSIASSSPADVGSYFVIITNVYGAVTSSVAAVTLLYGYPPNITNNPIGFVGTYGSSGTLGVGASGTMPMSYQWFFNGTNVAYVTNSVYTIAFQTLENSGNYSVVVTNAYGSATSSIAAVALLPTLTSPFTGGSGLWGQNTSLSVGAIGSGNLSYQWYFNGQPIAGATGSSYGLGGIQLSNAGLYSVVVSSAYGSVTNAAYQVVVDAASVDLGLYPAVGITGTVGYSYLIQSSTDLGNTNGWVNETNLILSAPYQKWSDYSGMGGHKFYRVLPGQ